MFLRKELKSRENPQKKLWKSSFFVKVVGCRPANLQKCTTSQIFYKDFTSIISYQPLIIVLKFNNNYFQRTPLCKCFWKFWKLNGALEYRCSWNSKTSYVWEFQEQLFSRIHFTFHSLFFVNPLMPGGNDSS